jgi:hypothetical protein
MFPELNVIRLKEFSGLGLDPLHDHSLFKCKDTTRGAWQIRLDECTKPHLPVWHITLQLYKKHLVTTNQNATAPI